MRISLRYAISPLTHRQRKQAQGEKKGDMWTAEEDKRIREVRGGMPMGGGITTLQPAACSMQPPQPAACSLQPAATVML